MRLEARQSSVNPGCRASSNDGDPETVAGNNCSSLNVHSEGIHAGSARRRNSLPRQISLKPGAVAFITPRGMFKLLSDHKVVEMLGVAIQMDRLVIVLTRCTALYSSINNEVTYRHVVFLV